MADIHNETIETKDTNNRSSAVYTKNIGPYILSN